MKQVKCQSGLTGSQYKLHESYKSFEEFKWFCQTYGIHKRLGFASMKAAWESNPTIQSSTNPSDLKKVYFHVVRVEKTGNLRIAESIQKDSRRIKGSLASFINKDQAREYFLNKTL